MTKQEKNQQAYYAYVDAGENYTAAARALGIAPMTLRSRVLAYKETLTAATPKPTAKPTVDLTVPRCGTCWAHCDPFHSDEGYSHCCNDRIEYPEEYAADPWFLHEML